MPVDDAIIQPKIFRRVMRKVNRRAFLLYQSRFIKKLLAKGGYDTAKAREIGPFIYYPGKNRDDFGIAGPVTGAPAAALTAEFLITLGCQQIITFGTCGSIHGRYRIGSAVVPEDSVSEEGTSGLYLPGRTNFQPDGALTKMVEDAAMASKLNVRRGRCWTTDALFRETVRKVEGYKEQGCHVVDMEFSALCAVAEYRQAALAGLFVVSDELFKGKWKHGFLSPRFRIGIQRGLDTLLALRAGPL